MKMVKNQAEGKETLISLVRRAIELLCKKNLSEVVVLSSYKINSVLKDNFGVNIKVDKIGRILSRVATLNKLKRLNTNIPKYKLRISKFSSLQFY
ncbi:hypothetical protein LCGC14_0998350 [marine sediment metagenome]|uniref:Uncharacterized protein n=1 Tax=marine sediment metagenome TaxID=412755 RepID=A0A0F9N8G5_9ZZZZ